MGIESDKSYCQQPQHLGFGIGKLISGITTLNLLGFQSEKHMGKRKRKGTLLFAGRIL